MRVEETPEYQRLEAAYKLLGDAVARRNYSDATTIPPSEKDRLTGIRVQAFEFLSRVATARGGHVDLAQADVLAKWLDTGELPADPETIAGRLVPSRAQSTNMTGFNIGEQIEAGSPGPEWGPR